MREVCALRSFHIVINNNIGYFHKISTFDGVGLLVEIQLMLILRLKGLLSKDAFLKFTSLVLSIDLWWISTVHC